MATRGWFRCTCTTLLAIAALTVLAPAPAEAGDPIVQPSICRGPGFWGTHAGNERGNTNMVQALLDQVGCLEVCGEIIDDTDINSADSAEEGLCVAPKSSGQVRLARFLLTQAMNCILSTGDAECDPDAWEICNAACVANDDPDLMGQCQQYLDCQAEGGYLDFEGNCITGTCQLLAGPAGEGNGGLGCGATVACPEFYTCVPTEGCDDAELVNEGLGIDWTGGPVNSSSENRCKRANKTRCAVVGANEAECATGTEDEDPEECPECFDCDEVESVACNGLGQFGLGCLSNYTLAEGCSAEPLCLANIPCELTTPCVDTSDCGTDEYCAVDTCCGASGICIPLCVEAAPERGGISTPGHGTKFKGGATSAARPRDK